MRRTTASGLLLTGQVDLDGSWSRYEVADI